ELLKKSILQECRIEDIEMIVSGGAQGADFLAENFAKEYNLKKLIFKPEWKLYGAQAGFLRNTHIVDNSDMLIAFWNGESSGTKDSIVKAKQRGIPLIIINYEN
ncbi:MAG: DUF2493 domain-containing protein, partial [Elusimicrobiota bacterium]|nr:DUF2493 domain-containing protein [Elusimicrobiota bacterium]